MKKIIILSLIAGLSYVVLTTLYHTGTFQPIDAQTNLENISLYKNVAGTEDLDIDEAKGLLFISSDNRWLLSDHQLNGIYVLDLNKNDEPYQLMTTYEGELHPHGISYLKIDDKDYLFVVNHNNQGDFIELFEFKNNQLIHLRSFENEQMCCPNDLVAIDIDKFYVSNDHGYKTGLMRTAEDYLRIPAAYILYFDGHQYTKVYEDLNYPNGINISKDGKTVYVAETTGRQLSVLDRDPESGKLFLRFKKDLKSGIDNITIDAENNLWIASHPKLLAFVEHAENTGKYSPSQVLKLTPSGNNDFSVEEVYLNKGEQLSGSSTALFYNGEVFVGVVFENQLLRGTYH